MDRKTNGSRGMKKQKVMSRRDKKALLTAEVTAEKPILLPGQQINLRESTKSDVNVDGARYVEPPEPKTEYIPLRREDIVYKPDGEVDVEAYCRKFLKKQVAIEKDSHQVITVVKAMLSKDKKTLTLDETPLPSHFTPEMRASLTDTYRAGLAGVRAQYPDIVVIKDGGEDPGSDQIIFAMSYCIREVMNIFFSN